MSDTILRPCYHYTCFIADLLQSLIGVCVLFGGSFDEEAQPGLSKAKFKTTCIDSYACFIAVLLQFSVCVCACSVWHEQKKLGKVWVKPSFKSAYIYMLISFQSSVCVCVCVLYGGSFGKEVRQGLSNAIF